MWDIVSDAVIDSLKILPLLLIVYIVIEIIEANTATSHKLTKLMRGGFAPLIGGAVGLVPQCGFSVVASNLYAKKSIKLGTLIAVFIATSDEAVPILLSTPGAAIKLLPLLGLKLVAAVAAGYAINFFMRKKAISTAVAVPQIHGCHGHKITESDTADIKAADSGDVDKNIKAGTAAAESSAIDAKKKALNKSEFFKRYLLHPLLHTLTVFAYILAVNLILGTVIYFVTEQRLIAALDSARYFQPFIAALVGLIPNCASSVVISQLYAAGALNLGAAFAGLAVNAGLGLAVLFKQNKNLKENLLILLGLYVGSAVIGLLISFLPI